MAEKNIGEDAHDAPPFAMLGSEPVGKQPRGVWRIPADSIAFSTLTPKNYFVTTGEAVTKASRLEEDLRAALKITIRFRKLLEKTRGSDKYLETQWAEPGVLLVKAKNPRRRKPPREESI